jgi:CDP-glycerol glycerophosphotransferase
MTTGPLISVVLPVRGVRRYLERCLDSILLADGPEIEVIAVNDASPDGCGRLLDERAAVDGRVQVIHLEVPQGPGPARNTGLGKAAGEYVWFVDADDQLAAGSLAAVAARLRADRPDVLLIDYCELHPDGSSRPSPGRELLRAAPAGLFTLADQPQVINLTMTAWSKVFRRDFLLGLGTPFPAGIHEDIPVTSAALLTGRLAALARPCYRYRRSRPGSFLVTPGRGHLAVFGAYRQVFERLERMRGSGDPRATDAVRAAVFERAIWHYSTVLGARGRRRWPRVRAGLVPRGDRRAFFARMHAEFTERRPPGYRLAPGPRGARLRLISRGAYRSYRLLEPLNRVRVAASRAAGRRIKGDCEDLEDSVVPGR